jgi:hypothetical protein
MPISARRRRASGADFKPSRRQSGGDIGGVQRDTLKDRRHGYTKIEASPHRLGLFVLRMGMGRGKCRFRQRDLVAALKAARAAGLQVVRYEIGADSKIVILTADSETADTARVAADQIVL